MRISTRSQIVVMWWALAFTVIYALALGFLLHMLPPPDANQSAEEIKNWYLSHSGEVKLGATIASWTSAFMIPYWAVVGAQMWRQEKGPPIWTILAILGGAFTSIFLVLPPMFFGVAAFAPGRDAEITATLHQLGVLALVTTDQYFVISWVALSVICLLPQTAPYSPFPRWFGYLNACLTVMFELGAPAYNFVSGPFSWNGVFVFWLPFGGFGLWMVLVAWLLLRSLHTQLRDEQMTAPRDEPESLNV